MKRSHKEKLRIVGVGVVLIALLVSITGLTSVAMTGLSVKRNSNGAGAPSDEVVTATGMSLVPMIENNSQFQALERGMSYSIDPYSSFGYQWGTGIPSIESIVFYSPNHSAEIEVDVFLGNDSIQRMYFDNLTLLGYSFA